MPTLPHQDPPQRAASRARRAPAWCLVLIGWCAGAALPRTVSVADRRPRAPGAVLLPARLPPQLGPAVLRGIDGVGARRAVTVGRHLWERGAESGQGLATLEEVAGVGPTTARAVRAALRKEAPPRTLQRGAVDGR